MTIRHTLLRAFLLIGLFPAILLASLAFVKARETLRQEIDQALMAQADAISSDIDKVLFERLQNAATWSTLEVMQDVQVQDVDKRLSNFLAKLNSGYGGVYRDLVVTDTQRRIVSASDAVQIGKMLPMSSVWRRVQLAGADIVIEPPQDHMGSAILPIRISLVSQFDRNVLGQLILHFDLGQLGSLLDRAAVAQRAILVMTKDGAILSSSKALRDQGIMPGGKLSGLPLGNGGSGTVSTSVPALGKTTALIGWAQDHKYAGFSGLGLYTLVIQPEGAALAPVHHMAWIFLTILIVLAILTIWSARWISTVISRPIVALTNVVRQYTRDRTAPGQPPLAAGEVGELGRAFVKMMQEIEQSQSKLVRASKLAMVGEMSAVIAHEVRTPLGILRTSAQMLRRETGLSEDGRELMGFIESETERLNRLVSAMLDSARPRPLNRLPNDVHQIIRQSHALLSAQIEKHQLVVTERFEASDPIVECDAEQMTQVLLNLILNALQILRKSGRIEVATKLVENQFQIDISDDGPGIPENERVRIFEAFFFKREGGVGLGLAIVQQIVANHGGDIDVGVSLWGGARFRIRIPRQSDNIATNHE